MIESLITASGAELTQSRKKAAPVVLSTRIRLARNLATDPFPDRATPSQRRDIMSRCEQVIGSLEQMKKVFFLMLAVCPNWRNRPWLSVT